jgi:hypothetical protein
MADVPEALRRAVDFGYADWLDTGAAWAWRQVEEPEAPCEWTGLCCDMGSEIGSSTRRSGWRTQRGRQRFPKELDLQEVEILGID